MGVTERADCCQVYSINVGVADGGVYSTTFADALNATATSRVTSFFWQALRAGELGNYDSATVFKFSHLFRCAPIAELSTLVRPTPVVVPRAHPDNQTETPLSSTAILEQDFLSIPNSSYNLGTRPIQKAQAIQTIWTNVKLPKKQSRRTGHANSNIPKHRKSPHSPNNRDTQKNTKNLADSHRQDPSKMAQRNARSVLTVRTSTQAYCFKCNGMPSEFAERYALTHGIASPTLTYIGRRTIHAGQHSPLTSYTNSLHAASHTLPLH